MMHSYDAAVQRLSSAFGTKRLETLYGKNEQTINAQRARYTALIHRHEAAFHADHQELLFVSAPGRTEICGNHTDHNHGVVMAAAVTLDTVFAVTRRDDDQVNILSESYPEIHISLEQQGYSSSEYGTSAALVRGIAARLTELGYSVGGFDAVVTSGVLGGSGLSSSAAYEVAVCAVFDALYIGNKIDEKLRAQIAQYAENLYFGKPCGLLDQMASSVGGMVYMDFKDKPLVEPQKIDFRDFGYTMVVVNTRGSHDDLTDDYAAIRYEMQDVAAFFHQKSLRAVPQNDFFNNIGAVRNATSDRAVLRAKHFFDENERVKTILSAVQQRDMPLFLETIVASGYSSWMQLQNVYANPAHQQLGVALALAEHLLKGRGAWRVHGGGFAGTTLNFVPNDTVGGFIAKMEKVFGDGCCFELNVRPEGAAVI